MTAKPINAARPRGFRVPTGAFVFTLGVLLAGCGSGAQDTLPGEPTAVAVASQPAMAAQVALTASGPTSKTVGSNLIDLSGEWQTWSGSGATVRHDPANGGVFIPASTPGNDMVIGVRRFDQPLAAGRSYTLDVSADNAAAAAIIFLFDGDGQIIPVPDTPDGELRFARTGEPMSFAAPGNVAGFWLQIQNQWQAPAATVLSAALRDGRADSTDGDGLNLITVSGDWPDWFGQASGVTVTGQTLMIPPPANGAGNRIGVQRFAAALEAGARYELSVPDASDDEAAALLFLIDETGGVMEFADASSGARGPWLAATRQSRRQFVAPEGVAGFAIQVQSGWLATSPASVTPALRLAGGVAPCLITVEQPTISFGPGAAGNDAPLPVPTIDATTGEQACES